MRGAAPLRSALSPGGAPPLPGSRSAALCPPPSLLPSRPGPAGPAMASGWQSEASLAALKEQRRRQREELLAEVGGPARAGSLQPLGPGLGAGGGAGGSPWGAGAGQGRAGQGLAAEGFQGVVLGGGAGPGHGRRQTRPHRGVPGAVAVTWLGSCSLPTSQSRGHRGGFRYMQVSPRAHRELFLSSRASLLWLHSPGTVLPCVFPPLTSWREWPFT